MKYINLLNKFKLTFLLLLISSSFALATHIVGGALTYVYNGGNNYTVSLKLWRDTTGTGYQNSYTVYVRNSDGSTTNLSITSFDVTGGTATKLPKNLDPCAVPPNPMPGVEERTYTANVDLPLNPGGYHLFVSLLARNNSISNINYPNNTANSVGETFYAFIPGPWIENFSMVDGSQSDNGKTSWTRTKGTPGPTSSQVNSGVFRVFDDGSKSWFQAFPTNNQTAGTGVTAWTRTLNGATSGVTANTKFEFTGAANATPVWTSTLVNISAFTDGVNLSALLSQRNNAMENTDSIFIYYSLDGGAETLFSTNGKLAGNIAATTSSTKNLTGNTIQIIVRAKYNNTNSGTEVFQIDDITISPLIINTWTSQQIDISSFPLGVNLSADISETSTLDQKDTIQVYYSVDGGPLTLFSTNGQMVGEFTSTTATQNNISGSNVQIIIKTKFDATTAATVTYTHDNIKVVPNGSIWMEDFTLANATIQDVGATAWTRTMGSTSTASAEVNTNEFRVTGFGGGSVTWSSQAINIASYTSGVNLSMDIFRAGTMENDDSLQVYYSLNGGPLTLWTRNGSLSGNFTNVEANASGLIGTSIQLFVRARYSATSPASEIYRWDNVQVASSVGYNSSPTFGQAPPLFLCKDRGFTYDHSATDLDGDSLVYSFYSPYDTLAGGSGANGGTNLVPYVVNSELFLATVDWKAGYSASSPLNAGGPALTIDPISGILTGTPTALGKFVVGIKVSEYRNGVLLSEIGRDYQFNISTCYERAQAYIVSGVKRGGTLNVCSGNNLKLPNNTQGNPSTWFWDSGSPTGTFDNNAIKEPTVTYQNPGTYTVTLIINRGTQCADTSTVRLVVGFVTAQNIWASTNVPCINIAATFTTGVASVSSNNSVTGYSWNFGDGTPIVSGVNTRTVSHAFASAGTFTVSVTATSSLSCTSTTQTVVNVYAIPTSSVTSGGSKDITICANTNSVAISGSTNATASWSSPNGTGSFNPNNSINATSYTLSNADRNLSQLLLILTATGQGACNTYTIRDTLRVNIIPLPTPSVGGSKTTTVCANNPEVNLSATVGNGSGTWSTNGTGSFSPNNSSNATSYILSNADTASRNIRLILTATGISACNSNVVRDTLDVLVTPEPLASVGISKSTTVCASNRSISVAGSASNGTGIWSSTGTGSFIPNTTISATSYTLSNADTTTRFVKLYFSVTGSNGCSSTTAKDSLSVTITPEPQAAVGVVTSMTVCANSTPIPIAGTAVNGVGIWSTNGTGTFDPNNTISAVSYSLSTTDTATHSVKLKLTVTGTGVCGSSTDMDSLLISITPEPKTSVGAVKSVTVCANAPVINLSGTASNASASWWSSGTGAFIPNNSINAVSYTLSDADTATKYVELELSATGINGCLSTTKKDTLKIYVVSEPIAIASAVSSMTVCAGIPLVPISGAVYNATGTWSTSGSGSFITDASISATSYSLSTADTAARSVKLMLTATALGACTPSSAKDSIIVTITPEPIASVGMAKTMTVCANAPLVPISGSATNGTGLWSTNNGSGVFKPDAVSATTYTLSDADTAAKAVNLYYTVTGDLGCSTYSKTDSLLIHISPEPFSNVGVQKTASICANTFTVNISGSATNATGIWSSTGTGSFIANTGIGATSYSLSPADTAARTVKLILSATGFGGCSSYTDKDTLTVTTSPAPNVSVGLSKITAVCSNNADVILTGNVGGATGGIWTSNGSGSFIPDATSLSCIYSPSNADTARASISLTLTTTGNGFCNAVKDTLRVIMNEAPHARFNAGVSPVCKNDSSRFYAASSTGIVAITNYDWNFGDGNTGVSASTAHLYNAHGIYAVKLRVTDANGCKDSLTQSATVHPLPIPNYSSTAQCYKGTAFFTDLSTVTNVDNDNINAWVWTFGDGASSSNRNTSHLYALPNFYSAKLVVTTNYGCVDSITQVLNVKPAPIASFTNTSVCLNKITTFGDLSTLDLNAGTIINRDFYFGDNVASDITSTPSFTHTYPTDGVFTASLIVEANNGCSDTSIQNVITHPLPVADFESSVFCLADKTMYTDKSTITSGSVVAWQWNFGNGNQSQAQNDSNKYDAVGQYGVSLKVTSGFGCENSVSKIITINPSPVASFYTSKEIIELYGTIQFTDASQGANYWTWDFGDGGNSSSLQSPSYSYSKEAGTFTTKLVVKNNFDCADSITKDIIVKLPPKIPNAFSPNGDGENDVLFVLGGPYRKLEFRVLNNWGEFIFSSKNQSQGWDGTKNGVKQPIGVYVYTVEAETEDGEKHILYGDVTLLR
jgi:gliding motility-associated-like protein